MFHCDLVSLWTFNCRPNVPTPTGGFGCHPVPADVEGREVVWSHVVRQRLAWQMASRGPTTARSAGGILARRCFSFLNHDRLVEWQNSTAYFNGNGPTVVDDQDLVLSGATGWRWTQAEPGLSTTVCFDDDRSESASVGPPDAHSVHGIFDQ